MNKYGGINDFPTCDKRTYGRNEPDLVDSDIEITHWMSLPELPKEG